MGSELLRKILLVGGTIGTIGLLGACAPRHEPEMRPAPRAPHAPMMRRMPMQGMHFFRQGRPLHLYQRNFTFIPDMRPMERMPYGLPPRIRLEFELRSYERTTIPPMQMPRMYDKQMPPLGAYNGRGPSTMMRGPMRECMTTPLKIGADSARKLTQPQRQELRRKTMDECLRTYGRRDDTRMQMQGPGGRGMMMPGLGPQYNQPNRTPMQGQGRGGLGQMGPGRAGMPGMQQNYRIFPPGMGPHKLATPETVYVKPGRPPTPESIQ